MTVDKPKYFIIGHITEDIITVKGDAGDPKQNLGGSVSYGAITAHELGWQAHIITKCNPEHPHIQKLEEMGIIVHCLPIKDKRRENLITSFTNIYDEKGGRTQTVENIQEKIFLEDLGKIQQIISPDRKSIIHIAPVIGEIDPDLIFPLSKMGFLLVTPQGYFRERQRNGSIRKKAWDKISLLTQADLCILSMEDITIDGKKDHQIIRQLRQSAPIFILTKQRDGSVIYEKGKTPVEITAFHLEKREELDFTGCGDVYAAAFAIYYLKSNNLKKAGNFASFHAAKKISSPDIYTISLAAVRK